MFADGLEPRSRYKTGGTGDKETTNGTSTLQADADHSVGAGNGIFIRRDRNTIAPEASAMVALGNYVATIVKHGIAQAGSMLKDLSRTAITDILVQYRQESGAAESKRDKLWLLTRKKRVRNCGAF